MQRTIERFRCKLGRTHRLVIRGAVAFGLMLALFTSLLSLNVTTVTNRDGESYRLLTANSQPDEIIALAAVMPLDETLGENSPAFGTPVVVYNSFPVVVQADGREYVAEMSGGTVEGALERCGITLSGEDYTEPALDAEVRRDEPVQVRRVTYAERSLRSEVLDEQVEAFIATLPQDEADNFVYSKSRIYDVTFNDTLVDGAVRESEVLSLEAVYHPYDAPSAGFEAGVPVSSIDAFQGIEIGEDGIPTTYSRVMRGAVATAYSASAGRGAGGQGLYCGTVAVNPNVIPYGTRLYITAADGSFVYGYAIASDCGTAMMEGYVDVDLYFESNAECRKFGKRALDVYILD